MLVGTWAVGGLPITLVALPLTMMSYEPPIRLTRQWWPEIDTPPG